MDKQGQKNIIINDLRSQVPRTICRSESRRGQAKSSGTDTCPGPRVPGKKLDSADSDWISCWCIVLRWLTKQSFHKYSSTLAGFPSGSDGKASACNAGDPGLIPGSGRCPGEGNGNPLQYSCLENPMDGEAW